MIQTLPPQNLLLQSHLKQGLHFKLGSGNLSSITALPTGNVFLTLFWGTGVMVSRRPTSTESGEVGGIYVSGQQFEISHISLNIGEINIIQFELTPNAIYQFFGVPQQEMTNQTLRLEDVWSNQASRLYQQVINEYDLASQISIMEKFLCGRILSGEWRENTIIAQATRLINQFRGNICVKELATSLRICTRSLERKFSLAVGISPKAYCKVMQFNYAFRQLALSNKNIIDIAYEAGYYDQPHFANHFRKVCGMGTGKFFEQHEKFFSSLKKNSITYTLGPMSQSLNIHDKLYIF